MSSRRRSRLALIAPGLLVAATGVGAGDLITTAIAGSRLGLTVLWAVVLGALFKWVLNEGLARWQLATDTTLLAGWVHQLGRWMESVFLGYLGIWSFVTGGALMSACGVAGQAIFPFDDPHSGRAWWGLIHGVVGLVLVRLGGIKLFSRAMTTCIAVMFVTVIVTAALIGADADGVISGFVPSLPDDNRAWLLGVIGGVGGTVTLLSYGYWIRDTDRRGYEGLVTCRWDLGVAYLLTAVFGASMIVIGSHVDLGEAGSGASMALPIADALGDELGVVGRWAFLIGFWGAVFSSLMGVWQSVPFMVSDLLSQRTGRRLDAEAATHDPAYIAWQVGLTVVPLPLLFGLSMPQVQLLYAVLGSLFMPLLAVTLLIMNNRERWVGSRFKNDPLINGLLAATLLFFLAAGAHTLFDKLNG